MHKPRPFIREILRDIGLSVIRSFNVTAGQLLAHAHKRFRVDSVIRDSELDTEMVKCCCVYKCRNVCNSEARAKEVSFFRFPKDKRKRRAWTNAVNRDKWTPNEHSWICSDHFVEGWHGDDPGDENYAPTLFSYKKKRTEDDFDREQRRLDRETIRVSMN